MNINDQTVQWKMLTVQNVFFFFSWPLSPDWGDATQKSPYIQRIAYMLIRSLALYDAQFHLFSGPVCV